MLSRASQMANGKESTCQCRRPKRCRLIPWSGRSPGVENDNYSSIVAWKISWTEEPEATVRGVSKSQTWLSECMGVRARTHTHTHTQCAKHCILSIIPSSQQKERYPQYLGGDTEAQRSCQKPTVISSDTQVPVSNCCSKGPWKAESSALRVSVTGKKRQLARRKGSDAETSRALIPWERAHTLTTATKTG